MYLSHAVHILRFARQIFAPQRGCEKKCKYKLLKLTRQKDYYVQIFLNIKLAVGYKVVMH